MSSRIPTYKCWFWKCSPQERAIVHFHGIYRPSDYPPEWKTWFFSEQYMIAAVLLANPDCMEILLPAALMSDAPQLSSVIEPVLATSRDMEAARIG